MIRALVILLALATGAHAAPPDPALIEAARKEGSVNWYSTLIVNQILRPMTEAFEKKYPGIKVQYSRATSSDVALKIRNEARAHRMQADVFDGPTTVFPLEESNLVADFHPSAASDWAADLRDANGHWTAQCLFIWAAAVNTGAVKPEDIPKTYEDLLNPRWKGQIAWTNDPTPGGPPGFIHNILASMGQEKGMAYLHAFAAQQPVTIPAAQRVVLDKVISGEYPLAVMTLNYHSTISAAQGAPVRWLRLEPLLQSFSMIGVVKDAPHPNAARLLVEFILSDEGQKIMADNDYLPASPHVPAKVPANKPDAGGLHGQYRHRRNGARRFVELGRDLS